MASSATINDPRHYTARDGRILPVSGTHERDGACGTCNFTPIRPVNFAVGQRVAFTWGGRARIEGMVTKVGRRLVSVVWTTREGRRHETKRRAADLSPASQGLVRR